MLPAASTSCDVRHSTEFNFLIMLARAAGQIVKKREAVVDTLGVWNTDDVQTKPLLEVINFPYRTFLRLVAHPSKYILPV